jgi:hypothetical protein
LVESISGESLDSAATWGDIFPALLKSPSSLDLAPLPVDRGVTSDFLKGEIALAVVGAILERQAGVPLDRAMPLARFVVQEIPWYRLTTRPENCLRRRGISSISALLQCSFLDLAETRNAGTKTVKEIVHALAEEVIDSLLKDQSDLVSPDLISAMQEDSLAQDLSDGERRDLSLVQAAINQPSDPLQVAYSQLASWSYLVGAQDQPLLADDALDTAPDRVRRARASLLETRAVDIAPHGSSTIAEVLDSLLGLLDSRQMIALRLRTFASEQATLDEIGKSLGVTRERVRQMQNKALEEIESLLAGDYFMVREVCEAMKTRIGVVCPIDLILEEFPALAQPVKCVDAPAWRVLDRLDDGFEIRDGWAAVPSVDAVLASTREVVERDALVSGYARVETVGRDVHLIDESEREHLFNWLEYAGCVVLDDAVAMAPLSIPASVWIVLRRAGEPLSFERIMEQLPIDRAPSSVRNVLAVDERFVRTNRDEFGLAEWGLEEYSGIRDMIQRALDESGGEILLEVLVEQLTQRFSVAEASVRAYAQGHPFMVRNGLVRVRDSTNAGSLKRPTSVKRVYRGKGEWLMRWQLTEDHARGSGYSMPSPLAAAIGLQPGQSLDLPSPVETQSVYWTGLQPAIGSVRRLMEKDDLQPGDWIFVSIADDGFFSLRKVADTSTLTGVGRALALVGRDPAPATDARAVLAAALGIPDTSSWSSIVEAARAKHDEDLADAILGDPGIDVSSQESRAASADPTDVDEIMRLLQ